MVFHAGDVATIGKRGELMNAQARVVRVLTFACKDKKRRMD